MERQRSQKEKSLAWFKLAELVARGEREKALSVFRLLAHSLPDRAYVLQIEGDILWYLDDKGSGEKYKQAAFLYQKDKRWIDAIAVYEHLLTQNTESYEALAALLVFYAIIDWPEKFAERFMKLAGLLDAHRIDEVHVEKAIAGVVEGLHATESSNKDHWLLVILPEQLLLLPEHLSARLDLK